MKKMRIILVGSLVGVALLMVGGYVLFNLMNSRTYQLFGKIVPRVSTSEKVVALTFDDGPSANYPALLKILADKNVKATFFVIGQDLEQHPEAAQALVAAGHQLGNHSYTHQRMVFKSYGFMATELEKTDQAIREAGYKGEIFFRPPYGKKLVWLPWYLQHKNQTTVTWDVEPNTFVAPEAPATETVTHVLERTQPGSIILLHPWYEDTNASLEALPGIIDGLKAQGYRFVTITELLSSQP